MSAQDTFQKQMAQILDQMLREERRECALLAERIGKQESERPGLDHFADDDSEVTGKKIADAIRARNQSLVEPGRRSLSPENIQRIEEMKGSQQNSRSLSLENGNSISYEQLKQRLESNAPVSSSYTRALLRRVEELEALLADQQSK